jgi:hypothetical protein
MYAARRVPFSTESRGPGPPPNFLNARLRKRKPPRFYRLEEVNKLTEAGAAFWKLRAASSSMTLKNFVAEG